MKGTPKKLIDYLIDQDKEKIFEIKPYKEKRSTNQNSYYWELVNELALKLRISPEEIHKDMIKHYSQSYQILVPSNYELRGITYYDKKSKIQKDGKEYIVYQVYTPSHELKTDEFALLLNGIIEEAKIQGIDTRTPEQIRRDDMYV